MKKQLFIALLLCCISLNAQQRSESEAIQIAKEFLGKKGKTPRLSVVSNQKVDAQIRKNVAGAKNVAPAKSQSFYVVNDEANNRFVIVSADERMYTILGYSDNGTFYADSVPEGLMDILYGYNLQYDYLLEKGNSSHNYRAKKAAKVVEPLIKTQWGQGSPYNNQCPKENILGILDMNTVTGCVATAMAQVMNFYKYPSKGQGYTSYTTSSNIQQNMNFSSVNFDWPNMTNVYDDSSSEIEKSAVAELMHACGVAVHMDYSWLESGAYAQDMAYALINYFCYNPNIKYYERRYFSKDDWDGIIQEDLVNGRPVLYSGMGERKNSDGTTYRYGHQFVLDGCNSEGMYHFNFGWEGKYDGFFELTSINPEEGSDYTLDQAMVCNVSPETIGKHEDIFFATAVLYDKMKMNVGSSITATFDPHCAVVESNSYGAKFNGEFGIGVFDMNKNFVKALYRREETRMSTGSYYEALTVSITFDRQTFVDGSVYYIAPYAKANNSTDYTWMRTTYGLWDYYIATVQGGIVTLGNDPLPIPTGTVYASAFDADNSKKEWKFTLNQDANDKKIYWFDGFDPALSGDKNRVKGTLDDSGAQIRIEIGQSIGDGLTITNYSSPGDILVSISAKDSIMTIDGAWGTLKINENGDNITQEIYSQYSLTEMSFKNVPVETPMISFDKVNQVASIVCSTEDAKIYYTTDGSQPTTSSSLYTSYIPVTSNCTIKAIAEKNGELSYIAELVINEFIVEKPIITVVEDTLMSMSCATKDAIVYYTLDGSSPANSATRQEYKSEVVIEHGCMVKAIGTRTGYNDSEIVEKYVPGRIDPELVVVIENNIAGQLEERVGSSSSKSTIKQLVVSGQLNGTDIAFVRDLIINNSLTDLNIANATIVSGGSPYYKTNYSEYSTKDDVVGNSMFDQCKNLVAISLPISAKTMEMFAFNGCESLTTLSIPCQNIESMAIRNCKNLESIHLETSVKKIDGESLTNCSKLSIITTDSDNPYFTSVDGILYSKDMKTIVKYPEGRENLSFVIPNSVTSIGKGTFEYAKNEKITIPESVTQIGSSAFSNCVNLKDVSLPNSIEKIGSMAFWGCRSIVSLSIPSELSEIESMVFYNCANLRECSIGKNVRKIAANAFDNCTTLQKFQVDEGNETYYAENGVLYSKNMTILYRCPLAYYAEKFHVQDGIRTIEDNAFDGCKSIGEIILPEGITTIGSSAFSNSKITSINMPSSITSIGYMAFWGCDELEMLILPQGITEIEDYMLYNCKKLYYLEIPENVTYIAASAIYGCKSLNSITCHILNVDSSLTVEKSYNGEYKAFNGISDTCTWHVPIGSSEYYKKQPWWVPTWRIEIIDGISNVIDNSLSMTWKDGQFVIIAEKDDVARIYELSGALVRSIPMKKGETYQVDLPRGVYIINNKKIMLK